MRNQQNVEEVTRYADMLSAMGTESRLRIMQLLLSTHPDGMVVGEIGDELEIPSSFNPAVSRAFTDTFAGIRPLDAPGFIVTQLLGAFAATVLFRWLVPTLPSEAKEVVFPRTDTGL